MLVLDKKLGCFGQSQIFSTAKQSNLAYHPGPVLPPGGDGSQLFWLILEIAKMAEDVWNLEELRIR